MKDTTFDRKNRVLFCWRVENVADRPEIMSAPSLEMTVVRNADVSFLRANQALRVLELTEVHSLNGIEALTQIRELVLYHMPKVHSLEAVGALRQLQFLTISTPASWDASRRCIEVDTLRPLANLKQLRSLSLMGVLPKHEGLRPLWELKGLRFLSIANVFVFRLRDYAELAAHLPRTAGLGLSPCYQMSVALPCRRCGREVVGLVGTEPHKRRLACLVCDRGRVEEHIAAWNAISGQGVAYPKEPGEVKLERAMHYGGEE